MACLPWFKVYAAETLSDERFQGWTMDERGAWFTLILIAWREGSIPGDQTSLAKLCHVDANAMRSLWSAIGDRFIPHPDFPGRLTSPRLEVEREGAEKLREKKSEAGKKGATSRWETEKKRHSKRMRVPCDSPATAMANDSDQDRSDQDRASQPGKTNGGLAGDEWLAGFRQKLAQRLSLDAIDIGKDRKNVLAFFQAQLAAVGEDQLLAECCDLAPKSTTGTPSSLAWFVNFLRRLPSPEATQ